MKEAWISLIRDHGAQTKKGFFDTDNGTSCIKVSELKQETKLKKSFFDLLDTNATTES